MQFTKKQKVAGALAAGAMAVAGGGVAFAYWTTTGSGTGSASAGSVPSGDGNVTIVQTSDNSGYNLGDIKDVVATVTNTLGYSVNVGAVQAVVSDSGIAGACSASNWVYTPGAALGTLTAGETESVTVGTLQLVDDTANNQDACQNAAPSLTFTADQGA